MTIYCLLPPYALLPTFTSFPHFRPSGTHTSSYCSAAGQNLTDGVKLRQTQYSSCFLSNSALRFYYVWHRAVWYVCMCVPMFRRNILIPSSGCETVHSQARHSIILRLLNTHRTMYMCAPFSMFSNPKFSCLWRYQAFVFVQRETKTAPNYRDAFSY